MDSKSSIRTTQHAKALNWADHPVSKVIDVKQVVTIFQEVASFFCFFLCLGLFYSFSCFISLGHQYIFRFLSNVSMCFIHSSELF